MLAKIRPEFIYTTYSGTLYSLTPENQVELGVTSLQFLLGDILRVQEVLARLPPTLSPKSFFHYPDKTIYLSSIDATAKRSRGCEDPDAVDIDNFGFKKVKNEQFLKLADLLKPDILVALTEESRGEQKGKKSLKRNIHKSLKFLSEAISHKVSEGSAWKLFAPFQGSFYSDLRENHLEGIKSHLGSIDGLVVYGLYDKAIEADKQNQASAKDGVQNGENQTTNAHGQKSQHLLRKEILRTARQALGPGKQVAVSSDGNPLKVLELVTEGVDFFESAFPFTLARAGQAWDFHPELWTRLTQNMANAHYLMPPEVISGLFEGPRERKVRCLNLNDKRFAKDLFPLVNDCHCYTCQNFTRAYIHHLLEHHEMTANVLLTIHNCFLYRCFFGYIQTDSFIENYERSVSTFVNFFTDEVSE